MNASLVSDSLAATILASCTDAEGYTDYEAFDMMMDQANEDAKNHAEAHGSARSKAAPIHQADLTSNETMTFAKENTMSRITELQTRIANLKATPDRWSSMLLESAESELKLEERHAFGMAIGFVAFAMLKTASPEQLMVWDEECLLPVEF